MDIGDAFRSLGLTPRASASEAKSAYRRLAKQWHPDRLQAQPKHVREEAEETMKTLNAAYGVVIRYLTNRTREPSPQKPWWWAETPPPASAGAMRRPEWFRGFRFEHPSFMRDTIGDYIGAVAMALLGLYLLGWTWTSLPDSWLVTKVALSFGAVWYWREAFEAIRD